MSFLHDIDPIALSLPFWPHGIHWYGLMYVGGFAAAWWLGKHRLAQGRLPGIDENGFGDLLFYAMLGVIVGGRVGFVLFYDLPAFFADPLMLFKLRDGGMSFHGGLLGVLLAGFWWCRKYDVHWFDILDFIAPLAPIGLGLGRLGNWINGELWGRLTSSPLGVVFPKADLGAYSGLPMEQLRALHAQGLLDAYARWPSQLLQAFLEGAVLFALLWWFSRRPRPRYAVAGLFGLAYGLFRIFAEFFREPDAQFGFIAFGWLTMGMLLSLPMVAFGLWLLWRSRRAPTLAGG
ncbi:prolipoprotein diacylglyceryl transferase [Silanimonas sp.]|uniref:prolipoprotein diacylglyceryl transferase n=1 Tax=Silanimonas sp. TaxID=1929290 RepID=UPI001BBC8936|nr:prolipoprotein diacylglyceryl transferase [Silanimonas sp.]MBS3897101.1 prolipoprotein diacylglyceryl transferase [Silanimonas sp.]MBS3923949.1 prolipoprotein diacylglyceryl transferase [Xanthomonadaceae bacterium]